jgi:hypothetical protein
MSRARRILFWGAHFADVPRLVRIGTRHRSFRVVVAGFVAIGGMNIGMSWWLDYGPPRVRDPEYGRRLNGARHQIQTHPQQRTVLLLGSSRVAMGIKPSAVTDNNVPVLLNYSLAGSGPIMELMAYRRARADGIRPDGVLIEYWPAFLREDVGYHEDARLDPLRLGAVDEPIVTDYFRNPAQARTILRERRFNPWFTHRKSLMNQLGPGWLPYHQRSEAIWANIEPDGWLPGRVGATDDERKSAAVEVRRYYWPLFANFEISEVSDRALKQLIDEIRADQIPLALIYLPESSAFRVNMTPQSVQIADAHLKRIQSEWNLKLLNTREWAGEAELPDGFHLTQQGAADYTRRLAGAIPAIFPEWASAP